MIDLSLSQITKQIHEVRGMRVMVDSDLSLLFQIQTRVLNQAARRNLDRFPEDFMFRLSKLEFENLKSQFVTSSLGTHGGKHKLPMAFSEQGVAMLSCVLNTPEAVETCIIVMRAFSQKKVLGNPEVVTKKLEQLEFHFLDREQKQNRFEQYVDQQFKALHGQIQTLINQKTLSEPANQIQLPQESNRSFPATEQWVSVQPFIPTHTVQQTPMPELIVSLNSETSTTPAIESYLNTVAQYFGIKVRDLKTQNRKRSIAVPRQIAIFLIRKHLKISFQEIGSIFGGRDHTTILHACQKISNQLTPGAHTQIAIDAIENACARTWT